MSQNKSKRPILIRDEGGIQTFRDPDTGREFSTTVSRPIEGVERTDHFVALRCVAPAHTEIAQWLASIRSAIGSELPLENRDMIREVRQKGSLTIPGLRKWKANQLASELRSRGFSVEVLDQ